MLRSTMPCGSSSCLRNAKTRASSARPRASPRVTTERRLSLAEARYVLALAEALPRSPDAVALLLRAYCS